MTQVVVVGAGVMGTGIAHVLAHAAGCEVGCVDRSKDQLAAARAAVVNGRYGLERAVERNRLTPAEAAAVLQRLQFTTDFDVVSEAHVVIESIEEDLPAKMRLHRSIGAIAAPGAVIASNTSGLSIVLAEASGRTETTVGWHWSSPAQVMRLAEIVRTDRTSDDAIRRVVELARRAGKNPVVVRESPQVWGFVANRVLFAAIREAQAIEREGLATADQIDTILVDAYRWPVGPFRVLQGATDGWGDGRAGSVASLLRP